MEEKERIRKWADLLKLLIELSRAAGRMGG
jgi:hypothetical protein